MANKGTKPMRNKYIIAVFCIPLLVAAAFVIAFLNYEPKPNPDDEKVIRQEVIEQLWIRAKDFNESDFDKITELSIGNAAGTADSGPSYRHLELANLDLLKRFTNMKKLELLGVHYPEDAIPNWVKFLAEKGFGNLDAKFALDLSPLKKLPNLEELNLNMTPISNLKSLANLVNLRRLKISYATTYTNITHMSRDKGDIKPKFPDASERIKVDLRPLTKLTHLEELTIYDTMIKDSKPLFGMTNLKKLRIVYTNVPEQEIENLKKALPNLNLKFEK